ncbi:MAG: histidine kinase [Gloeobacteraceae cyanobacterium ES-bin-316]|nr:histidine kinase [Ferruginibacter sp.]
MLLSVKNKAQTRYWLNVFAWYALAEACIQLVFFFILNNFGSQRISIIEFHLVMWCFQCLLIWPIWWVASAVIKKNILVQILLNLLFYALYSYIWFGAVQDSIAFLYDGLQEITRPKTDRQAPYLDRGYEFSFLNYQLLKHSFRLAWFYLAWYFYNYKEEETKRVALAVANKELEVKLLTWHLNPSFYFKTISNLKCLADEKPINAAQPILLLAKVMEYVIYEAKEKLIDVKKEIHFVYNYTALLNQQNNFKKFETLAEGSYEKLKISPLLLAGLIDRIAGENSRAKHQQFILQLSFADTEMILLVNEKTGQNNLDFLLQDKELNRHLMELYPNRFSVTQLNNNQLKLSIILDEEN